MTPRRWQSLGATGAVGIVLVGWITMRFGPLGWNPTDDGYILSQSRRLVQGSVPHSELISPRPLGSAILHIVDLALPLPLLDASRLVYVTEMAITTALFARLVYARPVREWGPVHIVGAALGLLVNLHVFPFMPWHTADGMFFVAAGFVLLMTSLEGGGRTRRRSVAFVFLGVAVLMKQSFVIAPGLALAWVGLARWHLGVRSLLRELVVAALYCSAPIAVYVALVGAFGGADDMLLQFRQAARTPAMPIVDVFRHPGTRRDLFEALAGVITPVVLVEVSRRLRWPRPWVREAALLLPRLAVAFAVVKIAASEHLAYGGLWGVRLMWALAAVLVVRVVVERKLDPAGLAVLATALMCSASWGYAFPNLMAGTMGLTIVHRSWEGMSLAGPRPVRLLRVVVAAATVAGVLVVEREFVRDRSAAVYVDASESGLTARLRPVDSDFGRVRTNPTTARYVRELAACIHDHPARYTAVLPDNPGIYPLLGLRNPFSIDWMFPDETKGVQQRLIDDATAVDLRGDYLVLFQTFSAFNLRDIGAYPAATPDSAPFFYGTPLGGQILATLRHGQRIACGGFVGAYAPRPSG